MKDDFVSEDDLSTFGGWLRYQCVDRATLKLDEEKMWHELFEEAGFRAKSSPKVGLMKFKRELGEEKYAVAIEGQSGLVLTRWVRCSRKGEIFIMAPRDPNWDPHISYHRDGTLHSKSYGKIGARLEKRQPLTGIFKGSEHLGLHSGHGISMGAICDPDAFDGLIAVVPSILGPRNGSVGFDLVEAGFETIWELDVANKFYLGDVQQREIFRRAPRPSLIITIQRDV